MTATTIVVTGTFLTPDNQPDTGTVTFTPKRDRELSSDIQISEKETVTGIVTNGVLKTAAGATGVTLLVNVGGYRVVESMKTASAQPAYDIRGDINVSLNTVDPDTSQLDATGLNVKTTTTITTASYTLTAADFDANANLSFTSAGSAGLVAVTVPADVGTNSLNPATGSSLTLIQDGTGQLVIGGPGAPSTGGTAGGVTVTSPAGYVSAAQYAKVELYRRGANDYRVWPIGSGSGTGGFTLRGTYSAGTTYAINDLVTDSGGTSYLSRVNSNIGNTPSTSPTQWQILASGGASVTTSVVVGMAGALVVGTGQFHFRCPRALTVVSIAAYATTSPATSSIIIDVNKRLKTFTTDTTVFTTQSNRPTIAIGGHDSGRVTNMNVTAFAEGDLIAFDIDQVGVSPAGSDLSVTIEYL